MAETDLWSGTLAATVRVEDLPASRQVVAIELPVVGEWRVCGAGASNASGIATLPITGLPTSRIYAVAIDDWGRPFVPGMTVAFGDVIRPTQFLGWMYQVTAPGVLPTTEPDWWNSMAGIPQPVGTAMMQAIRHYQPIAHGPVSDIEWLEQEFDPHWDNVVGLYRAIEGQIVDVSDFGGVFTYNTGLNIDSSEATPDGLPALKLSANRTAAVTTEELGTDDFTIEMWVKAKTYNSRWPRIWATRNAQNVAAGFHSSQYSGDGQEIISYVGGLRGGEGHAPYGVFHHIALVRDSGEYRNYVNGTDVTGVPQASQNDTNGVFVFGQGGTSQIDLWFSGVRITKGVARYTENFDPPTVPFPDVGPPL